MWASTHTSTLNGKSSNEMMMTMSRTAIQRQSPGVEFVYIYIYIYICVHDYMEKEREREREKWQMTCQNLTKPVEPNK